jgi:hypothetical protein
MNNAKSMSLRARINNFSKQHGISPQLTLQSFFAERQKGIQNECFVTGCKEHLCEQKL